MTSRATATLTFLFTDLEGSTRLWEAHPEEMEAALARHDELLRAAIDGHGGRVFSTAGDGLAAAFPSAAAALASTVEAQRALCAEPWEDTTPLRARMALHVGEVYERDGDYLGPALNRAARLMSAAHGGQVVLTHAAAEVVREHLPPGAALLDLGEHRLRDLAVAEHVFQLVDAQLPASFPPLRSLESYPQNLPVERTSLIGREAHVARIEAELDRHRLVTLTGVGGVGKTRLALQAAADVLERFADGAWLVPLGTVSDGAVVPGAVASALLVPERPGVTPLRALVDVLRSRRLLLVLDNCEHLLDAAASLANTILDECAGVAIIATSREGLGVDGEQILPTPSLALPSRDETPEVDTARNAPAVELFCARARAVRPDFDLTPANVTAVVELCTRLDGIPLAIELAAARVNALAPADILARLDRRFLLLTGGSRAALERHHTLRAAVDWSHDLLSEPERRLFARLSVFVGGFTLDSAEAVGAGGGVDEADVVDLLAGLVTKSMVVADDMSGGVRYRMLETLRQYGHDRLVEAGEAEALRTRHARHFLDVSAAIGRAWGTHEQHEATARFDREYENLDAALDWFLETRDAVAAAQLMLDSPLFSFSGSARAGRWQTRLRRFDAVLALADELEPETRAELLASSAWAASQAGDHQRAVELADESAACADATGLARPSVADQTLAIVALWANDIDRAITHMEAAVARSRAVGDGWQAFQLAQVGFLFGQAGRTSEAIETGEEALRLARAVGAPGLVSGVLFQLALTYRSVDPARALDLVEESFALVDVATVVNAEWHWLAMAHVQITLGRHRDALASCGEGLAQVGRFGAHFAAPSTLEAAARAALELGELETAVRLLAAAEVERAETGTQGTAGDVAARERTLARLRGSLDPAVFDAAWSAGRAMGFEELVDLLHP